MLGAYREPGPLSPAGPDHVQRGGDLRRRGRHCPAAGRPGVRHLLVGDAASPPSGAGRAGRRAARRLRGGGKPGGLRPRRAGAGPRQALESLRGQTLDDARLAAGIGRANRVRSLLAELRRLAYTASPCPLPALEMLIAEMLAIHFCSDQAEAAAVLEELLAEVQRPGPRRRGRLGGAGGAGVLGQSGGRPAGDEPAGGRRRPGLRHRVSLLPRPGPDPRGPAAHGGPGADGAGRSDGRLAGRSRRADLRRRAAVRRPRRSSSRGFPAPATAAWKAG